MTLDVSAGTLSNFHVLFLKQEKLRWCKNGTEKVSNTRTQKINPGEGSMEIENVQFVCYVCLRGTTKER